MRMKKKGEREREKGEESREKLFFVQTFSVPFSLSLSFHLIHHSVSCCSGEEEAAVLKLHGLESLKWKEVQFEAQYTKDKLILPSTNILVKNKNCIKQATFD